MAGELRTYDSDKVTAVLVITATGQAVDMTQGLIDGPGAIAETKGGRRWDRRGDRQGNQIRNRNRKGKQGELVFTYVAEAEIHDTLSAIITLDDQLGNQVGILTIRDLRGNDIVVFTGVAIDDDPAINYGDTNADRPYVLGYAERLPELKGSSAQ